MIAARLIRKRAARPPPVIITRFMKPSNIRIRAGARACAITCRCWGQERAPKLFMLHGWMDVSARSSS